MAEHKVGLRDILIGSVRTTELGEVWVAVSERGLITVEFGVCREEFEASVQKQVRRAGASLHEQETPAVREATCQIEEYLHGKRREFDMAIDWSILGSDFQRERTASGDGNTIRRDAYVWPRSRRRSGLRMHRGRSEGQMQPTRCRL